MTLRQYLKAHGLTQEEFAREVGAHAVSVNRWCNGQALPKRHWMAKIEQHTAGMVSPASFYANVGVSDVG